MKRWSTLGRCPFPLFGVMGENTLFLCVFICIMYGICIYEVPTIVFRNFAVLEVEIPYWWAWKTILNSRTTSTAEPTLRPRLNAHRARVPSTRSRRPQPSPKRPDPTRCSTWAKWASTHLICAGSSRCKTTLEKICY